MVPTRGSYPTPVTRPQEPQPKERVWLVLPRVHAESVVYTTIACIVVRRFPRSPTAGTVNATATDEASRPPRLTSPATLTAPHALIGTVDECVAAIEGWRERWGLSYISLTDDS